MKKTLSILLSILILFSVFSAFNTDSYLFENTAYATEKTSDNRIDISSASVEGLYSKVYSGKSKRPIISVILGNVYLVNHRDFTVSYSNNVNVGTASVKITGIGDYTGTIYKTFRIIPQSTKITKLKPYYKKMGVIWNKKTIQTTGYQIQFSLNKSFKDSKKIHVRSNTQTTRVIKGLKTKKRYYVRIRTYKLIGEKYYYSKWSKTADVKTLATLADEQTTYVKFVAVGDNLIHKELIASGEKSDGTRDYHSFYSKTKKYIQKADIASINQETILGGDVAPYSGFPKFNSPQEVGDAVADTGFDIMTLATNHYYDAGMKGITSALTFMQTKHPEVKTVGLYKTKSESKKITYITKNNIKIAVLNYCYRPETSQNPARPSSKPWLFTNLNEQAKIKSDVITAKKNADIVIAYPHWGKEYNMTVTSYMEKCTKMFSDLGVDIVIGTHPHVIAPVKWVKNSKTGKKMLVYYSLGNYVSFQDTTTPKMLEGMAQFTLKKEDGEVKILNPKMMPMVNYITRKTSNSQKFNISAVPLKDYTDEMAKKHLQPELAERKKLVKLFEKTVSKSFRGEY